MAGRVPPAIPHIETSDPAVDKMLTHLRQTIDPLRENPLFQAADFRWIEIDGAPPTFALQYRSPTTKAWATVGEFVSDGQPVWQAPTFAGAWVNFGAGNLAAGYMKDSLGRVHLRGAISTGVIGTVAFTLPAGFRPSANANFACASNSAFGYLNVRLNGDVFPTAGSNVWFSLDGVTFDTRA